MLIARTSAYDQLKADIEELFDLVCQWKRIAGPQIEDTPEADVLCSATEARLERLDGAA